MNSTEEAAQEPTSKWPARRIVRWAFAGFVGVHVLGIGLGTCSIAFPTPIKNSRTYAEPPDGVEDIVLPGMDSPAWFFAHPTSQRVVLLCHGRSRNKSYMLEHVARLHPHWNVLVFNFRNHGDNGTGTTTIGLHEADDVGTALDVLEARGFSDIVVYGTSMGGAAAILHLASTQRESVRGLLTDGTFAELREVLYYNSQRLYVPDYMTAVSMALAGIVADYDINDVVPANAIPNITVPYLALHGDEDPIVPVHSAKRLADAAGGSASHQIYPGVHDEQQNPARDELVHAFIQGL